MINMEDVFVNGDMVAAHVDVTISTAVEWKK